MLDRCTDRGHHAIKTWSLKRPANYGSKPLDEYPLVVSAASLSDDGRTVSLTIPEIPPTWGWRSSINSKGPGREPVEGKIHNAIHRLVD
jgi:hypothetical protein